MERANGAAPRGFDCGANIGVEVCAPLGTEAVCHLAEDDAGAQCLFGAGLAIERDVLGNEAILELCRVPDESQIDERLERANLVISWRAIRLSAHSFRRMRNCRGVVRTAVGYDNIDIAAPRGRVPLRSPASDRGLGLDRTRRESAAE